MDHIDILSDVPFLIYCFDRSMVITQIHGKLISELSIDTNEVLGLNLRDGKDRIPASFNHAKRALRGEKFSALLSFKERVFEVTYQPKSINDVVSGVVSVCVDVTARVNAERELLERENELTVNSRLAGLGKIAGGMAHEINNPLSIVLGNCHLLDSILSQEDVDKKIVLNRVAKIQKGAERVANIVSSLLSIFKGNLTENLIDVNLPRVIAVAADGFKDEFEAEGIKYTYEQHEGELSVSGNARQLHLVLTSLLSNSINAVKKLDDKWILVQSRTLGKETRITITDSGRGIPPDIRLKIFDPFFSTRDVNEGPGLGLSLVRQIMEHHGGTIQIDERAKNTRFILIFHRQQTAKVS